MRGIWAGVPGLLLGLLVAGAQAGEVQWHPSATGPVAAPQAPASTLAPAAGVGLGRPVALADPNVAPVAAPVISLGRPMAATPGAGAWTAMGDSQIQPASYSTGMMGSPRFTARGKADDTQGMPLGAPIKGPPLIETPNDKGPSLALTETPPPSGKVLIMGPQPAPPGPGFGPAPPGPGFAPDGCCDGGACGGDPCCGGGACCDNACCGNPCCGDPCCCGSNCPGMASRSCWVRADYLLWTIKDSHGPALVTTGALSTGGIPSLGATVIYGGTVDHEEFSGGRLSAGTWCDDDQCMGVEGSFFFLAPRTNRFVAGSAGDTLFARPFTLEPEGVPAAQVVAGPTTPPTAGRIAVSNYSRLFGGDINLLTNLDRCCWYRLDLLAGCRYLQLDEHLDINENPMSDGVAFNLTDHFGTRNQFWGGQLGLKSEFYWRRWQLDVSGKVALGQDHEVVDISGIGTRTVGGVTTNGFGLLAEGSNMGHSSHDRFAVAPELGVNLGYQLTDHLRAYVGYSFLYLSSVVRPENQIDTRVDVTQNPVFGGAPAGQRFPAPRFQTTDFWAQGANVGLEWRW